MTPIRLSPRTLASARKCDLPRYDRKSLRPRIVHLGLGTFFRAHGAVYTHDLLNSEGGDWGILGVSLQRPDQRDRLEPQGGLYTTVEKGPDGDRARIIGSVLGVLVAPENPEAVIQAMASPDAAIVTLTITEKGYCHDPRTGRLDRSHPQIIRDLENPGSPSTAIALMVEALSRRRQAGLVPFTVLSCDNLASNGHITRALVNDFAALHDPELAAWIDTHGAFPSTMVDRIVPATSETDRVRARELTGLDDAAPVMHEPFSQWVIEDRFVGSIRPRWELAGAQFASDVASFETMKLRMLNGSHSALAYLGYLAGFETINEAIADAGMRAFVQRLWRDEIIPVTPTPTNGDLAAYAGALLDRFRNPAIRHRTWQIAMDGSQKLPPRLLATVRARLEQKLTFPLIALAIGAWIIYVGGKDESGASIDVRDPLADKLRRLLDAEENHSDKVKAVLAIQEIFGDLGLNPNFAEAVDKAYASLRQRGAAVSVAAALSNDF